MKYLICLFLLSISLPTLAQQPAESPEIATETATDPVLIKDGTQRNFEVNYSREAGYPGGDQALYMKLFQEMQYPEAAKENKISGDLTLSFFVETDGSISELSSLNDLGYGTKEEAIRLVKLLTFEPAIQNGKPVRQQMMMPVLFRIYD